MYNYQIILGIVASVVGLLSYIPYFRDILKGKTRPHVFSWFVWGLLAGIVFFAQTAKGAGPGSWVTGLTAAGCFSIAMLALFRGEKIITKVDWFSFLGALLGIIFWKLTTDPLAAVVLVTLTHILAFVPTFIKAYKRPGEETISTFAATSLKFLIGLVALESYNPATWLYPASLVLINGIFVVMSLSRRKIIAAYS